MMVCSPKPLGKSGSTLRIRSSVMKNLVLALIGTLRNAIVLVSEAVQKTKGLIYVPASMEAEDLAGLVAHTNTITTTNPQEPAYLSLEQANAGRNDDGSKHAGYLIIDVANFKIVDLIDREGHSKLDGKTVHLDTHGSSISMTMRNLLTVVQGFFVVQHSDGQFYVAYRCRCPSLHVDLFWNVKDAQAKAREIGGVANEITSQFLAKVA